MAPFSFRCRVQIVNAKSNDTITVKAFREIILQAESTTASHPIFETIKVKSLTLYAPALDAEDEITPIDIVFTGSHTNEAVIVSNALESIPAMIHRKVPPDSVAAMWQSSGSNTDALVTISCPANCFLDISMSAVLIADGTIYTGSTLTGATAQKLLYGLKIGSVAEPLEGLAPYTLA